MIRKSYSIEGLVQGVGFRPYIYGVAHKLSLKGFVKNTQNGAYIEIEGDEEKIAKFEEMLEAHKLPSLASIQNIKTKELKPLYSEQFEIIQSTTTDVAKTAVVLPDMAI